MLLLWLFGAYCFWVGFCCARSDEPKRRIVTTHLVRLPPPRNTKR